MDFYEQKYAKELYRRSHPSITDYLTSPWFWVLLLLLIDLVIFILWVFQAVRMPDWLVYCSAYSTIPLFAVDFILMISDRRPIKRDEEFTKKLVEEGIDAQALWDLGEKYHLSSAKENAVLLRCQEGGLTFVPHWAVVDGVLPSLEEVREYASQINEKHA